VALVDRSRQSRLLIVGGAERYGSGGTEILRRFVDLAGGRAAELIVIATASAEPAVLEAEYAALFTRLGAGRVRALRLESRSQANEAAVVEALASATGVFFTGGDQLRITTVLGGTRTDSALQMLVRTGAIVLGGTSAGAAMMSGTMILGGEGPGVTRSSVRTGPGWSSCPAW
jgi:cyanophycinase